MNQIHQLLGIPTATLIRSTTLQDDLWFPGTSSAPEYFGNTNTNPIFVSVIYKENKVVQVENNVCLNDVIPPMSVNPPKLDEVLNSHSHLHLSVLYYADSPHMDTSIGDNQREEATHFLDMGGISYYDDIMGGITYVFDRGRFHSDDTTRLQPVTSTDAEIDGIIVHVPGMSMVPAGDGDKEQRKDFPDRHNTPSN